MCLSVHLQAFDNFVLGEGCDRQRIMPLLLFTGVPDGVGNDGGTSHGAGEDCAGYADIFAGELSWIQVSL